MLVLSTNDVTKSFGGLTAVNQFSFDVPEGKIYSIIGPNGAGKTTFFNCITGFYEFGGGKIEFLGEMLNGKSTDQITRLGISRTYQNIRLFSNMTAVENILVGHHPHFKTYWFEALIPTKRILQEEAEALEEAARTYEQQMAAYLRFLNRIVPPVMLLVVALIVLLLVWALFAPLNSGISSLF